MGVTNGPFAGSFLYFFNLLNERYNSACESEGHKIIAASLGLFNNDSYAYKSYSRAIMYAIQDLGEDVVDYSRAKSIHEILSSAKRVLNGHVSTICAILNIGKLIYTGDKDDEMWYKYSISEHGWVKFHECMVDRMLITECVGSTSRLLVKFGFNTSSISAMYQKVLKMSSNATIEKGMRAILFFDNFLEDRDKRNVIRFTNGVWDFDTKTFRPGTPLDLCTKSTNYDYVPPELLDPVVQGMVNNFLLQLFPPKYESLGDFVMMMLSTTLTPNNSERCIVFFYGKGRNGKTAFTKMYKQALGDYVGLTHPQLFLGKSISADKPDPHMVNLDNVRAAVSEEPEGGSVTLSATSKAITGSVDIMFTRKLHQNLRKVKVNFLPIICTNDKLMLTNLDGAQIDRIITVPFNTRFEPQGTQLRDDNSTWEDRFWQSISDVRIAQTFFNLLLSYWSIYDPRYPINQPVCVKEAKRDFILKGDPVGRFIGNCMIFTQSRTGVLLDYVWEYYREWYKQYVRKDMYMTQEQFINELGKFGVVIENMSSESVETHYFNVRKNVYVVVNYILRTQ